MSIDYRNDNTIVFTLARMNPPTPGHLYLIQRLIEEGINKRSYSSAEESDTDSDQEVIKMFTKKNNKKEKFDYIGYSFIITNKLSKMRSELARSEERLRYIQLDYNNNQIKLKEITGKCSSFSQENKKLSLIINHLL